MPTLSDAIIAIKAGRRDEGRVMLTRILADDGNNVTALLWMTEVATTPEERRKYLQRILAIDPNNAPARRGLELLDKTNEQPPWIAPEQPSTSQPPSADMAEDHRMSPDERRPQETTRLCPFCQKAIPADSSFCRFCGRELIATTTPAPVKVSTPKAQLAEAQKITARKTIDRWIIVSGIALLLVLIIVAVLMGFGRNNSGDSYSEPSPSLGDTGRLHVDDTTGTQRIPVATDETAMDELDKYITAHDYIGIQQMVNRGTAYLLPNDTAVKVIDIKGYYQQVHILDGVHKDEAVWTYPALITR
jgi:hypothetical protein